MQYLQRGINKVHWGFRGKWDAYLLNCEKDWLTSASTLWRRQQHLSWVWRTRIWRGQEAWPRWGRASAGMRVSPGRLRLLKHTGGLREWLTSSVLSPGHLACPTSLQHWAGKAKQSERVSSDREAQKSTEGAEAGSHTAPSMICSWGGKLFKTRLLRRLALKKQHWEREEGSRQQVL